jgi:hypothetical protein
MNPDTEVQPRGAMMASAPTRSFTREQLVNKALAFASFIRKRKSCEEMTDDERAAYHRDLGLLIDFATDLFDENIVK